MKVSTMDKGWPRGLVQQLGDLFGRALREPIAAIVPLAIRWDQPLVKRPRPEQRAAKQLVQFTAVHRDITRPRWDRTCLEPQTALQQVGIVAANQIHDLSNLVET